MSTKDTLRNYPEKTLLSYVEDPVAVISAKGKVVYLNPSFRNRFEVNGSEYYGKPVSRVLSNWMYKPILEQLGGMEPKSPPRNFWLGSDRERFRVSMGVIALNERVAGAVITLWDASNEANLKRQNLEIFRTMIKDVNYPLEEVKAILSRSGPMNDTIARSTAGQLAQMEEGLSRFIDFGELFFGEVRTDKVPFSPGLLLSLAKKSLAPLAEQKDVHLEDGSSHELPKVIGDPALLNRVLALVVDYMIKMVPPEQMVVISADLIIMNDGNPKLVFSVTGTGIVDLESEKMVGKDHLVEDFVSLTDGKKRLLLKILTARRLVAAMGGSITVAAHELAGTTISMFLPTAIHYSSKTDDPNMSYES